MIKDCPLCGTPCRIMYRKDGMADHYKPLELDELNANAPPIPPALQDWLRLKRQGKKTVAIVGSAHTSGGWAPYGEIEVWCSNEMHGKIWCQEDLATGWFQLHPKWSFTKEHRWDHWGWLQKERPFPIYMQKTYDDIPSCVAYPLREIQSELLGGFYRGEEAMRKLFSSSFSYMMALALYKGFERIEVYGIELNLEAEYVYQRESMAYWIGHCSGVGVEVWMPEHCSLLLAPLYAYEEVRKGDTGEILLPPNGYK
jgi:hypothetical protein